jgi:CheY-like chemotaxis protein
MSNERPSILFVDDERSLLDLYRHWFAEGYDVRTAADGEAALHQLDAAIDVVLLDRQMPGSPATKCSSGSDLRDSTAASPW